MEVPTYVYCIYAPPWNLLYVGVAKNLRSRINQHEHSSPWFVLDLHAVRRRRYPSRERALAVEKRAIEILDPLHNKQHKADPRAPKFKQAQSYRNWKAKGFEGFDVEAANALREQDL